MRPLTYYVGTTIDGFIAGPAGETDFFPVTPDVVEHLVATWPDTLPTAARSALGVAAAPQRFDACLMGRSTYEPALAAGITSPYEHLAQYVVSGTLEPGPSTAGVEVVTDPVETVRRLKGEDGLGVWLVGGGRLAAAVVDEVDALVVKVYPVLAGRGIPLLDAPFEPRPYDLVGSTVLRGGCVVLEYRR